jgi:hypothetical protein
MLDTLLTQIFNSDSTVSVLEHSIGYWDGNGRYPFGMMEDEPSGRDASGPVFRTIESCHIEQREIPHHLVNAPYKEFVRWALEREALPVAMYRWHILAQNHPPCEGALVSLAGSGLHGGGITSRESCELCLLKPILGRLNEISVDETENRLPYVYTNPRPEAPPSMPPQ